MTAKPRSAPDSGAGAQVTLRRRQRAVGVRGGG